MIFSVYRWFLLPVSLGLLRILSPFLSPKIRELFSDRQVIRKPVAGSAPCILIHAASGEIEYAKPVIRAIRKRWPQFRVVVSYYSPSAKKLHKGFEAHEIVPLPFDRPRLVQSFLDLYKPQAVLIARSDVWPEFVHQCQERGIHTVLFSATASAAGPLEEWFGRSLKAFTLSKLTLVTCVSEEDATSFRKLTNTPVLVQGDTRYEQVLERLKNARVLPVEKQTVPAKKIAVLGSTWPEDDEVFLSVADREKRIRWIWAPHEVNEDKIKNLSEKLTQSGLKVQRFSKTGTWDADVLLVDQIGVLAELYSWGDFAFVGGSFKKKVHSVMEPLAAGLPVIVGPHHRNNREALEFQKVKLTNDFLAVEVIENGDQALRYVQQKILPNNLSNSCEILRSEIRKRAQATDKLLDVIGLEKVTDISAAKSSNILSKT